MKSLAHKLVLASQYEAVLQTTRQMVVVESSSSVQFGLLLQTVQQ